MNNAKEFLMFKSLIFLYPINTVEKKFHTYYLNGIYDFLLLIIQHILPKYFPAPEQINRPYTKIISILNVNVQ